MNKSGELAWDFSCPCIKVCIVLCRALSCSLPWNQPTRGALRPFVVSKLKEMYENSETLIPINEKK